MKQFSLRIILCGILAWILSGGVLALWGHLNPVVFSTQLQATRGQNVYLFYTDKDTFARRPLPQKIFWAPPEDEWSHVQARIPRHKARHIRLGFDTPYRDQIRFKDITLDGTVLDLTKANFLPKLNVYTVAAQDDFFFFQIAGENAYITLPADAVAPFLRGAVVWVWLFIVLLILALCFWIYTPVAKQITRWAARAYPAWVFGVCAAGTVAGWSLFKYNAFQLRIDSLPLTSAAKYFAFLWHSNALTLLLLLLCILLLCCAFKRHRYLKVLGAVLGSALLFIEFIDAGLVQLLNTRFMPYQLGDFSTGLCSAALPFIKSFCATSTALYVVLVFACWGVLCVYSFKQKPPLKSLKYFWPVAVLLLGWYLIPVQGIFRNNESQFYDWPRVQLAQLKPDQDTTGEVPDAPLEYKCVAGLNGRQNIIFVLLESFSSSMSAYFSDGDAHMTPHLDALAKQHTAFFHHHATNFDTVQSLFSILTGIPALHFNAERHQFKDDRFYGHTFPKLFEQQGYNTMFFTSASLVYNKDEVLKRAGIKNLSHDDDPFYNGVKRFMFNSVPDDVLYARAEQWLEQYKQPNPYLLFIETATTHRPYIDPVSGKESLQATVTYADKALGQFIEHLQQNNLLENTLVIITSDHRVFDPLTPQQIRRFGPTAEAAVPLVVLGLGKAQKITATTSHIDLIPSLAYLTLPQACFHPYQENMFTLGNKRRSCTFFQSYLTENEIIIDCQGQAARVRLLSQGSEIKQGPLAEADKENALAFIDWVRAHNRY